MTTGLPLWDSLPPHNGTPTSREAAESVKPFVSGLRLQVLQAISKSDGLTDQQIADVTGLAENCVRPRRGELEAKGYVRDSGRTRLTRSGRKAVVWEANVAACVGGRVVPASSLAEAEQLYAGSNR